MGLLSGASHSNFRYTRSILGDKLRRKDNSKRYKRTARKERKAEESEAKEVILRRLKNARREEMEGRFRKIRYVLGEYDEATYAADSYRGGE